MGVGLILSKGHNQKLESDVMELRRQNAEKQETIPRVLGFQSQK